MSDSRSTTPQLCTISITWGHTLPTDDAGDVRTVELEPGKENFVVGRAPTWEVEAGGRSGVKDAGRQFRVEAEATGVQAVDGADGPMSDRLICITSDSTVGEVHELEARSRSSSDRCTVPGFCPHWSAVVMPDQLFRYPTSTHLTPTSSSLTCPFCTMCIISSKPAQRFYCTCAAFVAACG